MKVDLLYFAIPQQAEVRWSLGNILGLPDTPQKLAPVLDAWIQTTASDYGLFWDMRLGLPDPEVIQRTIRLPGDIWHAGLRLGTGKSSRIIDFIAPTWMFNSNSDPLMESTSFRLSFQACLLKTDILRQLGGPNPAFQTLLGAALEMGHRFLYAGVIMRHIPWLVTHTLSVPNDALPFRDELLFAWLRYGSFWTRWTLVRAVATKYAAPSVALKAFLDVRNRKRGGSDYFQRGPINGATPVGATKVCILIPTLGRYQYLRKLLNQIQNLAVKPFEVIIVDQTDPSHRDNALAEDFGALPLKVIYEESPGQCSSRNVGISRVTGEYILFLDDDDDEIEPDLIEKHLKTLWRFNADVSSGIVNEIDTDMPKEKVVRISDVFPTNNTLVRKEVLNKSGLFDLAYDRGERADGDLGMRVYLSGAVMVLNPAISVLHHHALSGGLRVHKARVITYSSSRKKLFHRNLPSVTEIYLALRYFTSRQVHEMLWLQVFGTFSLHGSAIKKILKILISSMFLPHTVWSIKKRYAQATEMLSNYPQIPWLSENLSTREK